MQMEVTKETKPTDIPAMADELEAFFKKTNITMDRTRIIADLEKRAAGEHSLSVDEWRAHWALQEKAAEPAEPEPVDERSEEERKEEAQKRLRGALKSIDHEYFWQSAQNTAIYRTWGALRIDAGVVMNLLSVGPSGAGKTEGLIRMAKELGKPAYKIDCASITTPDKWVGHKEVVTTANGPETRYVMSEHLRWLGAVDCEPGVIIYDEISRLHPSLLNLLIPILDGSQKLWVPDLGIYATVHPDTMISATANLGVGYSGTYGLDIALQDRFGVIVEQTFPPEGEEVKVLMKRTGIDKDQAGKLVKVAIQARVKANESAVSKYVSTRSLLDWARWVTTGMTMTEAAEATWVKKFSEDGGAKSERAIIRLILQGVLSGK